MKGFLNYNGTMNRWMTKIMYLVSVNLLFLVTSIPLVTIGASETALCTVLFRYEAGDEPNILRTYFRAFRENFKKSEIVWLCSLVLGGFLLLDLSRLGQAGGSCFKVLASVTVILAIFGFMILAYVFAAIAYFENSIRGYLNFSLSLAIAGLPQTFELMLLSAIPFALLLASLSAGAVVIPVFLCCGISLPAYLRIKILSRQFEKTTGKQAELQGQE